MEKILNTKIKNGELTFKIPNSIKAFLKKLKLNKDDLSIIVDLILKELSLQYDRGYSDGCNKSTDLDSDDVKSNDSDAIDLLRRLRDEDFHADN